MKGYVYILTNESMPGLVKIGRTTRSVEARANELHQTGVPTPFKIRDGILSPDCAEMELAAHDEFSKCRVSSDREFFRVDASVVVEFLYQFLEEQIRCLIFEYLPDHDLSQPDMFIDPSAISIISMVTGVVTPDVAQVIEEIRCDDTEFNFEALRERLNARRARHRAERGRDITGEFHQAVNEEVLQ